MAKGNDPGGAATCLNELVVSPPLAHALLRFERALATEALLAAYSADLECEHGHVPGTQPARCACFSQAPRAAAVVAPAPEPAQLELVPEPARRPPRRGPRERWCFSGGHPWTPEPGTMGRPPKVCPRCKARQIERRQARVAA